MLKCCQHCLVPVCPDARRDDGDAIVLCHFLMTALIRWSFQLLLWSTAVWQLSGTRDPCCAAEIVIHMDMCGNPEGLFFINEGFHVWILAISHNANKKVCIRNLAGIRVNDVGLVISQSTSTYSPDLRLMCMAARCFCSSCWI